MPNKVPYRAVVTIKKQIVEGLDSALEGKDWLNHLKEDELYLVASMGIVQIRSLDDFEVWLNSLESYMSAYYYRFVTHIAPITKDS